MLASIAAALVPRSSAKHATAAAAAAVVPVAAAQQGQIDIEGGSAARWEVDCDAESGKVVARRRAVAGGAARHGRTDEQHESTVSFVHGVPMPHFCGQRRWDELRAKLKGTLRPDDVVVSTYPKCGTTWTEQVVLLLLNGGNPSVLNPADKNSFNAETKVGKIWLEAMIDSERGHSGGEFQRIELRDFVALPSPRLIKTHNPVELFCGGDNGEGEPPPPAPSGPPPPCGGARVVYVSRNPMDACVSSYYHAFNPHKSGWPFDAWAAVWLAGCCAFGDWFSVTKGWHQLSTRFENVLFVQFEDLKASPRRTIRRIAAHIGARADDEALLARVIEGSTFHAMARLGRQRNDGREVGHLRKGGVGDWRNHFSLTLAAQFGEVFRRRLRGCGLTYDLGQGETMTA